MFSLRKDKSAFGVTAKSVAEFDIVEAFQDLDSQRKAALIDQLVNSGTTSFRSTARLFWPQSTDADARRLERLLRRQIKTG